MGEVETLGIIEEIQTLVSDKLQVVSYKWLSRNFMLPATTSKRLLQDFVVKHGNGLEVVYTISGWLKNNPSAYHIRLVYEPNLEEAKKEYDGDCSVQVYSVQASIPKDPAALWNAEFVQAEELFKQPLTADNCLLDNRFSGISNSFVKRNLEGTSLSLAFQQPKFAGKIVTPKSNPTTQKPNILKPEPKSIQQPSPKVGVQSSNAAKEAKTEISPTVKVDKTEAPSVKEKVPQKPVSKKKGQNDKNTPGNGGSIANMFGRASAQSKATNVTSEATVAPNLNSNASAEAQIAAHEAMEDIMSSDDEDQKVNFKRKSNGEGGRKRRVFFEESDEEDEYKDAVNLASPDPPKSKTFLDETKPKPLLPKKILDNIIQKESKPEVKEENAFEKELIQLSKKDSPVVRKGHIAKDSPENNVNVKDKVVVSGSTSPKRRKVLKTRIDERGREVTEVVWEGDEKEPKAGTNAAKKDEIVDNGPTRAPLAKKSPAVSGNAPSNTGGKAGNKKGGNSKDPKQGNIMSFFKKV